MKEEKYLWDEKYQLLYSYTTKKYFIFIKKEKEYDAQSKLKSFCLGCALDGVNNTPCVNASNTINATKKIYCTNIEKQFYIWKEVSSLVVMIKKLYEKL